MLHFMLGLFKVFGKVTYKIDEIHFEFIGIIRYKLIIVSFWNPLKF
jgi:hypothetical protein